MRNRLTVRSSLCCFMLTGALIFGGTCVSMWKYCGCSFRNYAELVQREDEDSREENGEVYGPPAPETEEASDTDSLTKEAGKESQGLQVQYGENQSSRQQDEKL